MTNNKYQPADLKNNKIDFAVKNRSLRLVLNLALVLISSLLIAVSAQISVPMYPVPVTLQTLAILLVAASLSPLMAVAAVAAYLLEGASGLPFFAGGIGGTAKLMGPTAGYLQAFILMALVASVTVRYSRDFSKWNRVLVYFIGFIVAQSVCLALGTVWLAHFMNLPLEKAAAVGAAPFIIGELLKAGLAATIVALLPQKWHNIQF